MRRDRERDRAASDRLAPARRDRDAEREQGERRERQHDAERADVVGVAQCAHGEALASQLQQLRVDIAAGSCAAMFGASVRSAEITTVPASAMLNATLPPRLNSRR